MDVRSTEPLIAAVSDIDPNSSIDEKTGSRFYFATVRFTAEAFNGQNILLPGMRGQAFFNLGKTSILEYFLNPLLKSGKKALTE